MKTTLILIGVLIGCDDKPPPPPPLEPCQDYARLLATTTGSPDGITCWHPQHRMRFEIATRTSKEEVAALVVCQCERDAGQ